MSQEVKRSAAETGALTGAAEAMPDVLATIVKVRQRCVVESAETLIVSPLGNVGELQTEINNAFLSAIARHRAQGRRPVIAEVKLGSPRLGDLRDRIDPEEQAKLYAAHGAAALSVVVEPEFFYGSYEVLSAAREASSLPALAKDFVVDAVQLRWAKQAGADAVLLIAALHDASKLRQLAEAARSLGLAPLVELHGAADLAKLADASWELVGVNNRDLRSFEVDLGTSLALLPRLPEGAVKVSESGLRESDDVSRLDAAGFDAFLVGESLLLAEDPAAKLRELTGEA